MNRIGIATSVAAVAVGTAGVLWGLATIGGNSGIASTGDSQGLTDTVLAEHAAFRANDIDRAADVTGCALTPLQRNLVVAMGMLPELGADDITAVQVTGKDGTVTMASGQVDTWKYSGGSWKMSAESCS